MPQIRLEYSDDLQPLPDLRAVFAQIHAALHETAGAAMANSKSRATAVEAYIGDGDAANALVHLGIELMEGRSTEVKARASDRCLEILELAFEPASDGRNLQITVDITDLERATYRKLPHGTIPTPTPAPTPEG